MTDNNTVRAGQWDGSTAVKCDHIACPNKPVVHFELSNDDEWAAECDLCEEHLPDIAEQARAFAVATGTIKATTELDHNLRSVTSEHMNNV